MDNVKLTFAPDALELVVDKAIEFKLGARGLRSIVESIMIDAMYEIPSDETVKKAVFTKDTFEGKEPFLVRESEETA